MDLEQLKRSWSKFIQTDVLDDEVIRPIVARSWTKCKRYGVDPLGGMGKRAEDSVFKSILAENQLFLDTARPIMRSVYEVVKESNFLMVLTDSLGYLISVIGDREVADEARDLRFELGSLWSELEVGSNAIGVALENDTPIQMVGAEHYCATHHAWTCSAAPIHGVNGEVLGCLNLSSYSTNAHPHTLGMVIAAAFGIESQLASLYSARLMHTALDGNTDSMLLLDESCKPIWMNKASERLFDMHLERLQEMDFRAIMPEIDWSLVQQWRKGKSYSVIDTPLVIHGRTLYCSATISPLFNRGNSKSISIILKKQEEVVETVNRVTGNCASFTLGDITAQSPAMEKTVSLAEKYAHYDGTVLIEGEHGTGKELFAQAIHNASRRKKGPFVTINCGGLPRELLERELLGFEVSASASLSKESHPGKLELANKGTIFIDEIEKLPLEYQKILLQITETQTVTRVGSTQAKELDIRIIAAADIPLKTEVEQGHFRDDLYFRLNVLKLDVPPLRERPGDIRFWAREFIASLSEKYPRYSKFLDESFYAALAEYSWPGNITQLQNGLEYLFFASKAAALSAQDARRIIPSGPGAPPSYEISPLAQTRSTLAGLLREHGGNVDKAAAQLGISRASMYRKIKKEGLSPKDFKAKASQS